MINWFKISTMYKFSLALFLCFIISHNIISQTNSPSEPAPQIKFDKKRHEFKDLVEETYGECYFKFYNTGDAPLKLIKVETSCGCTSPYWPKHPILPGDSSTIKVVFNSRTYAGRKFAKAIIITTNIKDKNSDTKKYVLTITGNVISKDDLIPQDTTIKISTFLYNFGEIQKGKKVKLNLEITNTGQDTLIIKEIQKSTDLFTIKRKEGPIPPGKKQTLKVVFDTENYENDIFGGIIKIITNIPVIKTKKLSKEGIIIVGKIVDKK